MNLSFKHSRIKIYLKEDRALRIETVINDPGDLGCKRGLEHLEELAAKARACNARLMDAVIAGQGSGILANPVIERIAHPTSDEAGRKLIAEDNAHEKVLLPRLRSRRPVADAEIHAAPELTVGCRSRGRACHEGDMAPGTPGRYRPGLDLMRRFPGRLDVHSREGRNRTQAPEPAKTFT